MCSRKRRTARWALCDMFISPSASCVFYILPHADYH